MAWFDVKSPKQRLMRDILVDYDDDNYIDIKDLELKFTDRNQKRRFFREWEKHIRHYLDYYANSLSSEIYNTKWKKGSKDIPFYFGCKTSKGNELGYLWFHGDNINYSLDASIKRLSDKRKKIPKGIKRKSVFANGRWFTPSKYKPDINIDEDLAGDVPENSRFFVSRTSHEKTHKYKKPMVWYQDRVTKEVGPVTLKDNLADEMMQNESQLYQFIEMAFREAVAVVLADNYEFDSRGRLK